MAQTKASELKAGDIITIEYDVGQVDVRIDAVERFNHPVAGDQIKLRVSRVKSGIAGQVHMRPDHLVTIQK